MSTLTDDFEEIKEPHRQGTIFFKMLTNAAQTKFNTTMNLPLTPMKLKDKRIEEQMTVTAEFTVSCWFSKNNLKGEHKAGLAFKLKELKFGDEPVTKKNKTEPEAEE